MSASLTLNSATQKNPYWQTLKRLRDDEPNFAITGLFVALVAPVCLAAGMLDDRLHLGLNIWDKPAKFAIALSVYLLTLAYFARFLPNKFREKTGNKIFSWSVCFAVIAEVVWIGGAAALGTSSHFNTEIPLLAAIYPLMGAFATLLTSASAVYAVQIHRNKQLDIAPAIKTALVIGLGLTLPLTLMTAGTMSGMNSHAVGGTGLDTDSMALIGWLRSAGDLRVGHFFATHALHVIPIFGVSSALIFGPKQKTPIYVFSTAYAIFVIFTFVQALQGVPFI